MISKDTFDQLIDRTEWKSNFHRETARILMYGNKRITSEEQLHHNIQVINSLHYGEVVSLSLTEIMNKGFYYSGI